MSCNITIDCKTHYWSKLLFEHGISLNIYGFYPLRLSAIVGLNRRAANPRKMPYLRSLMQPPTHLVCNSHLIANFLSFHISLVVVLNCGAGNALRCFEISMFYFFLKLYFLRISKDILLLRAQKAIKQSKWYFSRKPYRQQLRKCKIRKSIIMRGCTAAPYIMHDF